MTKNVGNESFSWLFTRGIQVGNIICAREDVRRMHNSGIIPNSNNKSCESSFPYYLPSRNNLGRDEWYRKQDKQFRTQDGRYSIQVG